MDNTKAILGCFIAVALALVCMCGYTIVQNQKLLDNYAEVRIERLHRIGDAVDRGYVWYKDGRQLSQDEIKLVVARDESFIIGINDETQEVTVMECNSGTSVPRFSLFPVFVP